MALEQITEESTIPESQGMQDLIIWAKAQEMEGHLDELREELYEGWTQNDFLTIIETFEKNPEEAVRKAREIAEQKKSGETLADLLLEEIKLSNINNITHKEVRPRIRLYTNHNYQGQAKNPNPIINHDGVSYVVGSKHEKNGQRKVYELESEIQPIKAIADKLRQKFLESLKLKIVGTFEKNPEEAVSKTRKIAKQKKSGGTLTNLLLEKPSLSNISNITHKEVRPGITLYTNHNYSRSVQE